ncbi:hypothetical protein [Paenibacillus sp. GCM10027629]|uniref:hypothetical protein n=1 Tax=Paenibacillus sp. GCM10027629 TaxID=3273414 RepID=UPI0036D33B89
MESMIGRIVCEDRTGIQAQMNLLGRVGYTEVADHTVLYLMSNGYTTGSTLFPDGGYILL